ncbi:hypothetical protein TgHK011_003131 [Trichoderma gracile]|nr:hypothetical protein TgHK011_003131 [Trichoderma gracile]
MGEMQRPEMRYEILERNRKIRGTATQHMELEVKWLSPVTSVVVFASFSYRLVAKPNIALAVASQIRGKTALPHGDAVMDCRENIIALLMRPILWTLPHSRTYDAWIPQFSERDSSPAGWRIDGVEG